MQKTLFYLLFFSVFNLHAQKKNTYYFDNELNDSPISKKEFKKKSKKTKYIAQQFEVDTAFIAVIFKRKVYGTLDPTQIIQLTNELKNITADSLAQSKIRVIHYFPGPTNCDPATYPTLWRWNTDDDTYFDKINEIAPVQVFCLFKNNALKDDRYKNKFQWFKDKNQVVENLFFKYVFPCGSFVAIASSGEFIAHHGEYSKQMVFDVTKELNDKLK